MLVSKVYTKVQGKIFFSGYCIRCNHDLCFVCFVSSDGLQNKDPSVHIAGTLGTK